MSSGYEDRIRFFVPVWGEHSARLFVGDIEGEGERLDAAIGEWCAFVVRNGDSEIEQLVMLSEWFEKVHDKREKFEAMQSMIDDEADMFEAMQNGFFNRLQAIKRDVNLSMGILDTQQRDVTMTSGVFGALLNWDEGHISKSVDDDGNPTMSVDRNGAIAGFFAPKLKVTFAVNKLTGEVEGIEAHKV